ncbi:MAG: glycosyltransferase [Chitinophagales bacterium]|nr:glycosyltransferase [Chitinophagales bacterium]
MDNYINLPLVTVCTLIYNSGERVIMALESVLKQYYPQERIQNIVIDDGSADNSAEIVKEWIDTHQFSCTFIRHKKNEGICKSLNDGLNLAEGKYFSSLGDDLWKPERLQILVREFEKLPEEYALLHTPVDFCNESGSITEENFSRRNKIMEGEVFFEILCNGSMVIAPSVIYRTIHLKEAGSFNEQMIYEDLDMQLKLAQKYLFKYIPKPLVIYRREIKNSSNSDFFIRDGAYVLPLYYIRITSQFLGKSKQIDRIILRNNTAAYRVFHISKYSSDTKSISFFVYSFFDPYILNYLRIKRLAINYFIQLFKILIFRNRAGYTLRDVGYLFKLFFNNKIPAEALK